LTESNIWKNVLWSLYLVRILPAFFSKCRLINHRKKKHEPQVLETCEVCSKQFVDLKRHQLTHTGFKHRCELRSEDDTECGKLFRNKSRLEEHINVSHRNFKKWICKYCEAPFSRTNQMYIHIRAVHLDFKVNCVVPGCGSIFSAKRSLSNHLKMVHKNLNEGDLRMYSDIVRQIPQPKVE
jgi:uncharacterized C2H2 Zn-finger protein